MESSDDQFNRRLVTSVDEVDLINSRFYSTFSYPWPPLLFQRHADNGLSNFLNQEIGCFSEKRITEKPRIWVAGCGTNQAVITALRYPDSEIIATDISVQSLAISRHSAAKLGITNITFREQSLLQPIFSNEFDYVICTGVIHHTGDPTKALQVLAKSLKRDGIMELMVYNYYHRIMTTAVQKAVRLFEPATENFISQLETTKRLVQSFTEKNLMGDFLSFYKNSVNEELADALIQPVEFSYTISSFSELLKRADLNFQAPCMNQFDLAKGIYSWNTRFKDPELRRRYEQMPDPVRWEITNLLMLNESPMMWFYVQRIDSGFERLTEPEMCAQFLKSTFKTYSATVRHFKRTAQGEYQMEEGVKHFPVPAQPSDRTVNKIFQAVRPELSMKEIFDLASVNTEFTTVNNVRLNLTTPLNPYLISTNLQK